MFLWTMGLLFLFVAELPIIHDPANRGLRVRRHLHEVETLGIDHPERFVKRHHAELLAIGADDTNFTDANLVINPRFPGASDKTPPSVGGHSCSMILPFPARSPNEAVR